jgi:hypothetical protein
MIKKYLTAVLLFISIYGYSQENKNRFMINGNVQYSHFNDQNKYYPDLYIDDYSNRNSAAGVNFGYFISNNFALGVFGSLNKFTYTSASEYHSNFNSSYNSAYMNKACGVFARYNHVLHNSKFGFFLNLSIGYNWNNTNSSNSYQDPNAGQITKKEYSKYSGLKASLNPGIIYFINSKFSVESTLGSVYYSIGKLRQDDVYFANKITELGASFSLRTVSLGFSYYFGGKKS